MNTEVLLDKLAKAVSFKFKDDKTAPGVTISVLKKGYYCSVVRYSGAFAKGKEVICSAKANTMATAIEETAKLFLTKVLPVRDPLQELDAHFTDGKLVPDIINEELDFFHRNRNYEDSEF